MKSSIIYKYIFNQLSLTFLICLAFLNLILTMNNLFSISKKFLEIGVSFIDFLIVAIFLQPQLTILTIPIALLLSILITYSRLNIDNELIIMRSSGMSLIHVAKPVFTIGTICFILSLFISLYLGPYSVFKLRGKISDIISIRVPLSISEGVFNTIFTDIVIVPYKKTSPNTFTGIFIYDGRKKEPVVTWAKQAMIISQEKLRDINIQLEDGTSYLIRGNAITEISFDKYILSLYIDLPKSARNVHELSLRQLLYKTREPKGLAAALEFHRRLSLPVVSLLMMLLGPALFPMAGKTGRLGGFSIGLSVCTVYYMFSIYLDNIVRAGKLHHLVGGWMPTVLLGIGAIAAFYKMLKRL